MTETVPADIVQDWEEFNRLGNIDVDNPELDEKLQKYFLTTKMSTRKGLIKTFSKRTRPCDGTDERVLREWLEEIEMNIPHISEQDEVQPVILEVVANTSQGQLRKMYEALFKEKKGAIHWSTLKENIQKAFLDHR